MAGRLQKWIPGKAVPLAAQDSRKFFHTMPQIGPLSGRIDDYFLFSITYMIKRVKHTAVELHLMWLGRLYDEQFDSQHTSNLWIRCCRSGFGSATVKRTESE
jgi:hypothetical protein